MTYTEIASTIKNNVSDGLKSTTNFSYSIEQIIDECILLRARFLAEMQAKVSVNSKYFVQKMSGILISCEKLNGACAVPIDQVYQHFLIPKPVSMPGDDAITFIGPMDNSSNFKVYYDDSYVLHGYRLKTAHKPFVFIDLGTENDEGYVRAYLMNAGKYKELKYLNVRGVFADPRIASSAPDFYQEEFHSPLEVQSLIVDTMVQKYITYYRQLNIAPIYTANTQIASMT